MSDFDLSNDLHPDRRFAALQAQTRRHFLQSVAGGIGSLFFGTLAVSHPLIAGATEITESSSERIDVTRDTKNPLSALPPQFAGPRKARDLPTHGGRSVD